MPIRYSKRGRKQIWRRERSCSSIYGNLNSIASPLCMVLRNSPCGNPSCITSKFEIVSFFSWLRACHINLPAQGESHSPWQSREILGSTSHACPGSWYWGGRGLLLQGCTGQGLPLQADPVSHPAPNIPELQGPRQGHCGSAQQQSWGLYSGAGHPAPAWFLVCSACVRVLIWILSRDSAPEANDGAAEGADPGRAPAAQRHVGESDSVFHIFRSVPVNVACLVALFFWRLFPFLSLLDRCRPRKQSSDWTRDRRVMSARKSLQNHNFVVSTVTRCT